MSYAPSAARIERIDRIIAAYPERSAAILPVLHAVQEEAGWISVEAEAWVAAKLGVQPIRIREVLSFYTMFRRGPAGRTVIQVCRNLSCTMAGAEDLIAFLREALAIGADGTSPDGKYTLITAECLGNCDNAPCLQVDGVDRGRVNLETAAALVRELAGR
jgi:NADH-quinone oxidoreductase subunit E